jgi:hypothetical protein
MDALHRLAIEQGHCDDLCNQNHNLLDDLDTVKDQCQVTEEECTELSTKICTLEELVVSLNDQLSTLKQQAPEPKRKKTHHSSSPPGSATMSNSFINALAKSHSSFIYLPVTHAQEFFSWICFGGDSNSI